MKDKILAKLVEKYKGLPKRFLELWATKLTAKVTDETQIEDTLTGLDAMPITMQELAQEWQKEGDRRVTEARKEKQPNEPGGEPKPKDEPIADDAPDWFKKVMTPLIEKITNLEQSRSKESITEQLKGKLKDLDIPEVFWNKRVLPTKPEELDTFVTDVKTDWEGFTQTSTDKGLIIKKPEQESATQKNKKIEDDILAYVKEENLLAGADKTQQVTT